LGEEGGGKRKRRSRKNEVVRKSERDKRYRVQKTSDLWSTGKRREGRVVWVGDDFR